METGVDCLLKVKAIYKQLSDKNKECSVSANIGWYYMVKLENIARAKPYLDSSLVMAKQLKDTLLIGKAYTYGGLYYQRKGYYKTAMRYFLDALPYKMALGKKNRIAFTYNLIGELYEKQERYDKSLLYHFKAVNLRKELENNDFHIG